MAYEIEIDRYNRRNSMTLSLEEIWRWQIRRTMERAEAERERRREASRRYYRRQRERRKQVAALRALVLA